MFAMYCVYGESCSSLLIVHPESFRSNAQNTIVFAHINHPRINHSDEFAYVYLHLRAFAIDRVHVHAYIRAHTCVYTCAM